MDNQKNIAGPIVLSDQARDSDLKEALRNIPWEKSLAETFLLAPKNFTNEVKVVCESVPHKEILEQLIAKIPKIDFREIAGLDENEKLKNNHLHVITIEQVIILARQFKWSICQNHDFIYVYNGAYWSLIGTEELKTFLSKAAEKLGVDKYKARHFLFRDQLFKQFIATANLTKPEQPKNIVFINLKNGTFEVTPNGTRLKDFNMNDFITYQLPFDYNMLAKAPLFVSYLNRVLPDLTRQKILAEYLGYIFIQPTTLKLEKTLLLYGTGANGKSVFFDIVNALFGASNFSSYTLQSLTNDNGYYRAMLANKLVNYSSEINGRLETDIFKQLVSGEPVEARLPYGDPFIITQYAKLIFNCNELPRDVEHTRAYFRRFLIIPFEISIPESEQDKELAQKIIGSELSGVFNWLLQGLNRLLLQKNFTFCEAVNNAREKYEIESDSVRLFIDETGYKPRPDTYKLIKELYYEYRKFCEEDGFKPVSKSNCIKRLTAFGVVIERKNIGNVAFVSKSNDMF